MAIPMINAELLDYMRNMKTRINDSPATFALTAAEALQLTTLFDGFEPALIAYTDAKAAGIQSKSLLATLQLAKKNLLVYARELYAKVQVSASVTDANKELLGVKVRKTTRTRKDAPDTMPLLKIVSRLGNTVHVKLSDSTGLKRGKPDNVSLAVIYAYVGATPPPDVAQWSCRGATGQTSFEIDFPVDLPAGTKVWLSAYWQNSGGTGPGCTPVGIVLAGDGLEEPVPLKLAA